MGPKIGIILGSDSDLPIMKKCFDVLDKQERLQRIGVKAGVDGMEK